MGRRGWGRGQSSLGTAWSPTQAPPSLLCCGAPCCLPQELMVDSGQELKETWGRGRGAGRTGEPEGPLEAPGLGEE